MEHIFNGGPQSVIAILCVAIVFMWRERTTVISNYNTKIEKLEERVSEKDDRIEEILENYYRSTITISEVIKTIREVLAEIKIDIRRD